VHPQWSALSKDYPAGRHDKGVNRNGAWAKRKSQLNPNSINLTVRQKHNYANLQVVQWEVLVIQCFASFGTCERLARTWLALLPDRVSLTG
jgi:hypothetical protein